LTKTCYLYSVEYQKNIEMAIFMNQFLFRTYYFDNLRNRMSDSFDKAGILEKDDGK